MRSRPPLDSPTSIMRRAVSGNRPAWRRDAARLVPADTCWITPASPSEKNAAGHRPADGLQRGQQRRAAGQQGGQRARKLDDRQQAEDAADQWKPLPETIDGDPEPAVARPASPGQPRPATGRRQSGENNPAALHRGDQQLRRPGQRRAEVGVDRHEAGQHEDEQHRQHDQHGDAEERRVRERLRDFPAQGHAHAQVGKVTGQRTDQVAGLLAGQQRGQIQPIEDFGIFRARIVKRGTALHVRQYLAQHRAQRGVVRAVACQLERAGHRHAGTNQRAELLDKQQQVFRPHAPRTDAPALPLDGLHQVPAPGQRFAQFIDRRRRLGALSRLAVFTQDGVSIDRHGRQSLKQAP